MSEQPPDNAPEYEPGTLIPAIRVAALSDYRVGRDQQYWLFAAVPPPVLRAKIDDIIERSVDPTVRDWLITGSADFADYEPGLWDAPEHLCAVATGVCRYGGAFAACATLIRERPDVLPQFEQAYCGEFAHREAWAHQLLRELILRAETELHALRPFSRDDLNDLANAAERAGDIHFVPTGDRVWVFRTT